MGLERPSIWKLSKNSWCTINFQFISWCFPTLKLSWDASLKFVEGLVILDSPNKLDARGAPGLGLVIALVLLCTCTAVASASDQVLPANACVTSSSDSGTERAT